MRSARVSRYILRLIFFAAVLLLGFWPLPATAQVTASATQLNFGAVHFGTAATLSVSFTNNGAVPVFFSAGFGALVGADFSYQTNCPVQTPAGSGLPLGGSCFYQVSLTPSQNGAENSTLFITAFASAANAQSFNINLTGAGVAFVVGLTPASLNFGIVTDGLSGPAQSLAITNNDTVSLYFSRPIFTGDFASPAGALGCGVGSLTLLSPGQSCTVSVVFTPQAVGAETGAVSVNVYNAAQNLLGAVAANLNGTGHPLSVPGSVSFGFQMIGTTTTAPTVIANNSPMAININTITLSGTNFTQTSNCLGSLAPHTQCLISASYTPTLKATDSGTLTITDGDATSPQTIQLSGTGTSSKISLSPANPRALKNSTLLFTAFQNGELIDGPVTWSSSNPAVATITGTGGAGTATLLSTGTTAITATHGGQNGSTVLAVTVAAKPVFIAQPTDTSVSAVINSGAGVQVKLADLLGDPLPGQIITMNIGNNAAATSSPYAGGTLSGALTQTTDATGMATFSDLKIDWWGPLPDGRPGYSLAAAATPISGPVTGISGNFNELRVGDRCLGPRARDEYGTAAVCLPPANPAYCADTDGDGLNDAWEMAGGIDMNGDGLITDSGHDLLLPGADPNKADIYVYYDWMGYGLDDESCASDSSCRALGQYHAGETCNNVGQCVYACTTDADCTSRSPATAAHAGEMCISNVCEHTHDPVALEPNTFKFVADRFAAHGINLHILRGKEQPHSHVVSFRTINQMDTSCEGGSVGAGTAGRGKYAESLYDLKSSSNPDTSLVAYHYALFSHYSGCDSRGHCQGITSDCPNKTLGFGQFGMAELEGNDLIISLGGGINNSGYAPHFEVAGTFMHELGHNLGMRHDGHKDEPCSLNGGVCPAGDVCEGLGDGQGAVCHETVGGILGAEEPNFKPNYLSIMNYMYERNGIPIAASVGGRTQLVCAADSDCGDGGFCMPGNVCARLDYSGQTLPTGGVTPGALDESNLDDTVGLGSGTADMFAYTDGTCHICPHLAATTGPVDWVGAGLPVDPECMPIGTPTYTFTDSGVHADIDTPNGVCEAAPQDVLHGHTDWPDRGGLSFVYGFACNATAAN